MAKSQKKLITFGFDDSGNEGTESPLAIALRHLRRRQRRPVAATGPDGAERDGAPATLVAPHLSREEP